MRMPTFFVIGAAKSGTTALYSYLDQHPEVFIPATQEPSWFAFAEHAPAFTAPDGRAAYINYQAITDRTLYECLDSKAADEQLCGDVSPAYLYWEPTPRLMSAEVPAARVVALLRHPVDRAYSAFMHARREGREPWDDFMSALGAEEGRVAANCGLVWRYRALGDYAPQLRRWFEFFPIDQFLIATYDEFAADPVAFCQRIQAFIGVDRDFAADTTIHHNMSGIPRSRRAYDLLSSQGTLARLARVGAPLVGMRRMKGMQARLRHGLLEKVPLDPGLRSELTMEWLPQIEDLASLVDVDVEAWLQPESARSS